MYNSVLTQRTLTDFTINFAQRTYSRFSGFRKTSRLRSCPTFDGGYSGHTSEAHRRGTTYYRTRGWSRGRTRQFHVALLGRNIGIPATFTWFPRKLLINQSGLSKVNVTKQHEDSFVRDSHCLITWLICNENSYALMLMQRQHFDSGYLHEAGNVSLTIIIPRHLLRFWTIKFTWVQFLINANPITRLNSC